MLASRTKRNLLKATKFIKPLHLKHSCSYCNKLVNDLKTRFAIGGLTRKEIFQLLTCTLGRLGLRQIKTFYNCSWSQARTTFKLRSDVGAFSSPPSIVKGKPLEEQASCRKFLFVIKKQQAKPGLRQTVKVRNENGEKLLWQSNRYLFSWMSFM